MSKDYISEADENFYFETFGSEEDLTPCNFYIPSEAEYIDFGEEEEEISVADAVDYTKSDKTGACWEGYERVPNTKKGEPGSCRKKGSGTKAAYKYKDPKTGQVYEYERGGVYKKDGRTLMLY